MKEPNNIIIKVISDDETLTLEIPQYSMDTDDLYYKFDVIATFLTYTNQSIENVYVNRANEINNFEIHESIKELNQEIDTLENKIIELEDELKKTKETKTVYMNQIDELLSNNALMYNELQEHKENNEDNCKQIGQLLQEKGILQNELNEIRYTNEIYMNQIDDLKLANAILQNPYIENSNKTFYSNPMDETTPVITTSIQATSTDIGTFTYTKDDI